jgi:ferric-dicitrate binding protein FerR (iron transport regulator)
MKNINSTIGFDGNEEQTRFPEIDVHYSVSKDEVWASLLVQMNQPKPVSRIVKLYPLFKMTIAASLLLLVGLTGFFRFYTKTITTPAGQDLTVYLPDSSLIELNAESSVKFHPYWFKVSRTITLNGEAFFKVLHGNTFRVVSARGETTVLGTSFNIFSRANEYRVTCFTGKVGVVSTDKNESLLLNPNEQAFLNNEGFLRFVQEVNALTVKSWRDNMFFFTGSTIGSVLKEIERQYNIKIKFEADPRITYTGNFSKSMSKKEVLDLVCTSLGLKFEVRSDTEFLVD